MPKRMPLSTFMTVCSPISVTADGAITLFADIPTGDEVVLMRGTVDSLISRAGRVICPGV